MPCCSLYSQTITVTVNEADYGNACRWEIERDNDGIFTRIIKRTISSGEVIEQVNVKKTSDSILTEYVVGKYKLIQKIVLEGNRAVSEYTEINAYLNTQKSGTQIIEYSDGVLTDNLNGALKTVYSYKDKWIKTASGEYALRLSGNNIYTGNGIIIKLQKKSGIITMNLVADPQILPPDVYTISSKFKKFDDRNVIINYLVLPFDLQFLLLL
jgi:hypothetical protein